MKKNRIKLQPLGDRVLIEIDKANEKTSASGIIIPDTVGKERPEQGTVIAVGAGRYDDGQIVPLRVKKGDQVIFTKYGPDEIKIDGEEYLIVSESNILAIIEK
ncbi:MAG: co-chaperone GroES [Candidatus Vogelbacteria bacterium RIFOXYD1_FULL_44_32]|uniref:Co-chaperonin GroES n=1 Tax=Candidatus Vogelbacteria bacterium RIFOXYD1_FULL_44_32 TaxID=1802438 RepID=A0A1G2QD01_9BACT|nr:MAG: co-chaperone GroES [Candidatus Vogelbacteria bacterium RIFOXYD1_FULL_44_32]